MERPRLNIFQLRSDVLQLPSAFLLLNTVSKLNIILNYSYVTRFRTGKRKKQRLKMVVPVRCESWEWVVQMQPS